MCGIFGVWTARAQVEALAAMDALLAHRGPDASGSWVSQGLGLALGHRRLSILDLSDAGRQPMSSRDGRCVLVFNGEIYNFRDLRRELEAGGRSFLSECDTEVLLAGYEVWGERVLDRVRGMFAFAIWDRDRATLLLARDATGVKPLFWAELPAGGFAFASEAKAFAAAPGIDLVPCVRSVAQYVEFGYAWDEERSMFEGVRKLAPGTLLRVRGASAGRPVRWWRPPRIAGAVSEERRADALVATLETVVAEHLVADVPIGLLLSGGLDSSVVAALACRRTTEPLRTISVGFEPCPDDERAHARRVAAHLGTRHEEIVLSPGDVMEDFQSGAWFYDDLFWDTGFVTSLAIYRLCRERGLKVVLVGEGSDEIFGGYRNFGLLGGRRFDRLPEGLHRYLFYRQYSGRQWGGELAGFVALVRRLRLEAGGDWFDTVRRYELRHQIPNNLNMKVDRASMASSVEARVPFQDRRVVEAACRAPREALLANGTNKHLLRLAARRARLLPDEIVDRPKFGMLMPGGWLAADPGLSALAAELVLAPDAWAGRLGVRPLVRAFFEGRERTWARHFRAHLAFGTLAWRLFVLELWTRAYRPAEVARRLAAARR